jgi:hypothetical protein
LVNGRPVPAQSVLVVDDIYVHTLTDRRSLLKMVRLILAGGALCRWSRVYLIANQNPEQFWFDNADVRPEHILSYIGLRVACRWCPSTQTFVYKKSQAHEHWLKRTLPCPPKEAAILFSSPPRQELVVPKIDGGHLEFHAYYSSEHRAASAVQSDQERESGKASNFYLQSKLPFVPTKHPREDKDEDEDGGLPVLSRIWAVLSELPPDRGLEMLFLSLQDVYPSEAQDGWWKQLYCCLSQRRRRMPSLIDGSL